MKTPTIAYALALVLVVGCGGSNNSSNAEAFGNLPRYPGANETESMEQSTMLGILSGELVQLATSDSFDQVLDFYTTELADHELEILNHSTDLGRQTAISIPSDGGVVTVAIQEFVDEGAVNITLMRVGS